MGSATIRSAEARFALSPFAWKSTPFAAVPVGQKDDATNDALAQPPAERMGRRARLGTSARGAKR